MKQIRLHFPPHVPKLRTPADLRCGRTIESIQPATFEPFINQCTKTRGHDGPHLYDTKGTK